MSSRIVVDVEILNEDGSHFSVEERGFLRLYCYLSIACVVYLVYNINKFCKLAKPNEDFDWAFFTVLLALIFQTISILLEWFHLYLYSIDG